MELAPSSRSNLLIYNDWETPRSVTSVTRLIKFLCHLDGINLLSNGIIIPLKTDNGIDIHEEAWL